MFSRGRRGSTWLSAVVTPGDWVGVWVGGGDNPLRWLQHNPSDFTPRARGEGGDADLTGEGDNPQLLLSCVCHNLLYSGI